jgi:hypothetical protein
LSAKPTLEPGAKPVPPADAGPRAADRFAPGAVTVARQRAPMPVITGCPRSGTSLLAVMLDSHSLVAMPPETAFLTQLGQLGQLGQLTGADDALRRGFFELVTCDRARVSNWSDLGLDKAALAARLDAVRPFTVGDGLRALYALYAERFGKSRWGEKTPTANIVHVAAVLPEAHFLHLIRDPRATVLSLHKTWFGGAQDLETITRTWVQRVTVGRAAARAVRRYHELRYEDLIRDPESVLRPVCAFLALEFEPGMLEYGAQGATRIASLQTRVGADGKVVATREERAGIHANLVRPPLAERVRSWEGELSADEVRRIEGVAGPLMRELGYEN